MFVLRIEHMVPDFDAWKTLFDSDPLDREASGVIEFALSRDVDVPQRVAIDLGFTTPAAAGAMMERLRDLWSGPASALVEGPVTRIFEMIEGAGSSKD
jgi:hypothetical protein